MNAVRLVGILLVCYVLGSLPFPYLVVRIHLGRDIRYLGDGNMGTRNAIRVAGWGPGLLVLLLDGTKGVVAFLLAQRGTSAPWAFCLAAACLLLGHWFPVWLRFRGGIGQGAASAFCCAMWPDAGAIAVPTFLLTRVLTRHFDVAYGTAAATFVAVGLWRGHALWQALLFLGMMLGLLAKKLADTPRQRRILAQQPDVEQPIIDHH